LLVFSDMFLAVLVCGLLSVSAVREPISVFDTTYANAKKNAFPARNLPPSLKAACDLNAFTCEEVIKFAELASFRDDIADLVVLFGEAREGAGCISDPENKATIVDFIKKKDSFNKITSTVEQALENLTAAKGSEAPPSLQLPQTGLRTEEEMQDLLKRMEKAGLRAEKKMEVIKHEIETRKEQFTGGQLVALIDAFPFSDQKADLMQTLEQYVTGVTCEEVIKMVKPITFAKDKANALKAIKANIIDGQFKGEIVAAYSSWADEKAEAEEILRDVGARIPPKNNPVFGVVKGNPVILVVDESGSMEEVFTLDGVQYSRRQFCHNELEKVLQGLPSSTSFNVIPYHNRAAKAFDQPVPVNEDNIAKAMAMVSSFGSGGTNAMSALQLAYETTLEPDSQIYFMTDGQPNGGADPILQKVDGWDNSRKIPVNSIAFIMPGGDPVAKQFMKDLATKTGGFFRAVEEDPDGSNNQD